MTHQSYDYGLNGRKFFDGHMDTDKHIPGREPTQGVLQREIIAVKLQIGDLQAKLVHMERMIAEHGNEGRG